MKDIFEAIRSRSSTRGYTDEKLTAEELEAILCAGLEAPTAANRQEIRFTVLSKDSPALKLVREAFEEGLEKAPENSFYYGAPTVIILSAPAAFPWSPVDAGIAVQNMALAAEGLGLGSLIIGCIRRCMEGERADELAKALRFEDGFSYQVAIAVGHKAKEKAPHTYQKDAQVTFL